jgi:hypothetical protein
MGKGVMLGAGPVVAIGLTMTGCAGATDATNKAAPQLLASWIAFLAAFVEVRDPSTPTRILLKGRGKAALRWILTLLANRIHASSLLMKKKRVSFNQWRSLGF